MENVRYSTECIPDAFNCDSIMEVITVLLPLFSDFQVIDDIQEREKYR